MSSLVALGIAAPLAALAVLLFRRHRPRTAAGAGAAAVALLLVTAETPLGIGNGTVPDLVGIDECTATERLAKRGLRWRFGDRSPVGGVSPRCDTGDPFWVSTVADPIVGQRPAPGTKLDEDAIVVLETACTQEPHCAPGAYDLFP